MSTRQSTRHFAGIVIATALLLAVINLTGCGLVPTDEASTLDTGSVAVSPDMAVSPPVDIAGAKDAVPTEEYALSSSAQSVPSGSGTDASTVPPADRLVVRTVDLRLKVDKVEESAEQIRTAAEKRKGIVVDYQVSTDAGVPIYRPYVEGSALSDGAALSGYITVRVPADQLQSFTEEISGMGKILRQAENEQDVTQEHVDLEARLVNLRATEAQLRQFYDKAKNVTEMLAIEQELSRVRGDIESLEAQIAYLERQAAMSTVTVELTGPEAIVEPAGEDWGFTTALRQAVRGFVGTINMLIVVLGSLAPLIVIGAAAFFAIRAIVRKRRIRRTPETDLAGANAPIAQQEDAPAESE